jgi:hypothetical protein
MIAILSCHKKDDDTSEVCTGNCTTLRYRFVTTDSIGIPGVKITLSHVKTSGAFSSKRRIIGTATSNQFGIAEMSVFINDDELEPVENLMKHFEMTLDQKSINGNQFFVRSYLDSPNIKRRDTLISYKYYFPIVNYITVNLNNFEPVKKDDSFYIQSEYGSNILNAISKNNSFKVKVAPKETNVLRIVRIRDGIQTDEYKELFVPLNNNITLDFDYKKTP